MLVGPDHRIAYANAEMATLVGIPREAVLGASLESLQRFFAGSFVEPTALAAQGEALAGRAPLRDRVRSEEHTSELQSRLHLVCRLLLEKKKKIKKRISARASSTQRTVP